MPSRLRLIVEGKRRDRRPTLDASDGSPEHFGDRQRRRPGSAPMPWIIAFALFSTRRMEAITPVARCDLDEARGRILIRDMKNMGAKIGNDIWCDHPPGALRIAETMARTAERIVLFGTDATGTALTRATQFLSIGNLRFHDLRHEGGSPSRSGWTGTISHAATVSGHVRRAALAAVGGSAAAPAALAARLTGQCQIVAIHCTVSYKFFPRGITLVSKATDQQLPVVASERRILTGGLHAPLLLRDRRRRRVRP